MLLPFLAIVSGWKSGTFLRNSTFKNAGAGTLLGLVYFGVIFSFLYFLPDLLSIDFDSIKTKAETFHISTPTSFLCWGLIFSIFHSLFEEFYWHWFLFGSLTNFVTKQTAILLAGAAFSLHHIIALLSFTTPSLAIFIGLLVGVIGSFWCYLYVKQKNILSAWISHIFADLAIVFVTYSILF